MGTKYEESLFYQINSCARYFHLVFEQFVKELNLGISGLEHLALNIIIDTKECCQRDLARIILKDRANTGKLANSLEEKGLIKIELKTKNNRPVKILTPTQKGIKMNNKIRSITDPIVKKIQDEITDDIIENTISNLKNLKNIVKNIIKTTI